METRPPVSMEAVPAAMFTSAPLVLMDAPVRISIFPAAPLDPIPVFIFMPPDPAVPWAEYRSKLPDLPARPLPLCTSTPPLSAALRLETEILPDFEILSPPPLMFEPTAKRLLCALNAASKSKVIACLSTS